VLPARAAAAQRATFWTRIEPITLSDTYHTVVGRLASANPRWAAGALSLIALVVLVQRRSSGRWPMRPPAHVVVCGAVCLALPALGLWIGGVSGVFHDRYVTFTGAGVAITIPLLIWWLTSPSVIAELIVAATVLHGFVHIAHHALRDAPPARVR